ncbi:GtrA family protein [Pseudomonas antarctica]|uniref:GtrA family protein n=1 Tax=Pseudomonas antarctica TaxID=219572 RepID=UPI00387A9EE3
MTIRELVSSKFFKFLLVGLMNSVFGYGCFASFLYLGLHYSSALLLATILGVLFNFKSTGSLVFNSNNDRLIFRFIIGYVLVYSVNLGGIALFSLFGVAPYVSGLILVPPMAVLSFLINNRFVFNHA